MANLIITIIAIALVAVAAIMGVYYGGVAFENGQINAIANAVVSESQQLLTASRIWSINNGQSDVSGMPGGSTSNGITEIVSGTNTGISLLISGGELAEWPPIGGGSLGAPQPDTGSITTGSNDAGCYSINSYTGALERFLIGYNGGNYVAYVFAINDPQTSPCWNGNGSFSSSTTDVSQAKHPIVLIAKAINAIGVIPSVADTSRMAYVGLPMAPSGSIYAGPANIPFLASDGTVLTNFCQVAGLYIFCVFGPS